MTVLSVRSKLKTLRDPNFGLLIIGLGTSHFGTSVSSLAIIWFFLGTTTFGPAATVIAGYWLTKLFAESLFSPFIGKIVDRMDRKKIIVLSDLIRGVLYISFSFFLPSESLSKWVIYGFYFVNFIISISSQLAVFSVIPSIVAKEDLTNANAVKTSVMEIAWLLGGILAGFLYARTTIVMIFILDGITFIISGISEMFIKIPTFKKAERIRREKSPIHLGIVGEIFAKKILLFLLIYQLILGFCLSPVYRIVTPNFAKNILAVTSGQFGILEAMMPFGIFFGALILKKISSNLFQHLFSEALKLGLCFLILSGISLLKDVGTLRSAFLFSLTLVLLMGTGMSQAVIEVLSTSYFQKELPEELRGSFRGIMFFLIKISMVLGISLFGFFVKESVGLGYVIISSILITLALFTLVLGRKVFVEI